MQYNYGCYYDYGRHLNEHPEDRELLINTRKKLNPDRIYRFPNIDDEPIIHYRGLTTEIVSNTTQLRLSSIDDKNDMPFVIYHIMQMDFRIIVEDIKNIKNGNRTEIQFVMNQI